MDHPDEQLPHPETYSKAAEVSNFTAAKVAWENGKFVSAENEFWLSDETSELETLQKAIAARFVAKGALFPDLLLIDGGRSQLQAAIKEKRELFFRGEGHK